MFGKKKEKADYSKVSLSDFSDDDSSDEENNLSDHHRQRRGGGYSDQPYSSSNGGEPDEYTQGSIQRQQELLQQQDQGLEMLSQSAERLGNLSLAISDELGQQNKMLDEMDSDLDDAHENLDFVTRKTKEFIEKSGGTKNCILIATLSGVALLLFFLILYT